MHCYYFLFVLLLTFGPAGGLLALCRVRRPIGRAGQQVTLPAYIIHTRTRNFNIRIQIWLSRGLIAWLPPYPGTCPYPALSIYLSHTSVNSQCACYYLGYWLMHLLFFAVPPRMSKGGNFVRNIPFLLLAGSSYTHQRDLNTRIATNTSISMAASASAPTST